MESTQSTRIISCPSEKSLRLWLRGGDGSITNGRLTSHVDNCDACQERVERLLNEADDNLFLASASDDSVETNGSSCFSLEADVTSGPDSTNALPPVMDGFEVLEKIGEGANGAVFLAEDLHLRRKVALKVLHNDDHSSDHALFLSEAWAVASLRHPYIVTLYHVGRYIENQPALVLELVDGQTLLQHLRQTGSIDTRQAVQYTWQIARALDHVHQQGLVHRDVKPSNIMIDNKAGVAKLTDFGLAQQTSTQSTGKPADIVGTPAYMSPQQIVEADKLDPRNDIYSLGVSLYQLVTGHLPFKGSPKRVLLEHLRQRPARPSRHNKNIDQNLDAIILKAMAKTPENRYATAGDMADDLRHWMLGQPIQARASRALSKYTGKKSRWRSALVTSTALTVCLAMILLGAWFGNSMLQSASKKARHAQASAQLHFLQVNQQKHQSVQATRKLIWKNTQALPTAQTPENKILRTQLLQNSLQTLAELKKLQLSPMENLSIRNDMAELQRQLQNTEQAESQWKQILSDLPSQTEASPANRRRIATRALFGLAEIAYEKNNPSLAQRYYRQSLEYSLTGLLQGQSPNDIDFVHSVSDHARKQGRLGGSAILNTQALLESLLSTNNGSATIKQSHIDKSFENYQRLFRSASADQLNPLVSFDDQPPNQQSISRKGDANHEG